MSRLARLPARIPTANGAIRPGPVAEMPTGAPRKSWAGKGSRHARGYGAEWVKTAARILKRDNYLCQACKRQGKLTALKVKPRDHAVDHIIPKARGGSEDDENLESLCAPCHAAKTAREWMA